MAFDLKDLSLEGLGSLGLEVFVLVGLGLDGLGYHIPGYSELRSGGGGLVLPTPPFSLTEDHCLVAGSQSAYPMAIWPFE